MFLLPAVMVLVSAPAASPIQERADRFLDLVNATLQGPRLRRRARPSGTRPPT